MHATHTRAAPRHAGLFVLALAVFAVGCSDNDDDGDGDDPGITNPGPVDDFPLLELPGGFAVEQVASALDFPTSVAWDDEGRLYVAEGGGGLLPMELAPPRILRVEEDGGTTEIADLSDDGITVALIGMTWHDGAFWVTHRDDAFQGAVSRVTLDGEVTRMLGGIEDSASEHQINDIRLGPDNRMYITVGMTGNAAVVGADLAGFVEITPDLRAVPCQDIVLTGRNFLTPDFRTPPADDVALTGAFVPFGTATEPGQTIGGTTKCGGSILTFDPADPEGSLAVHAWGFRNPLGLAWRDGELFLAQNGMDLRGSRPVRDIADPTLRILPDGWYGHPDFSAARGPLTDEAFEPPDPLQAPVYLGGTLEGSAVVGGTFIGPDLGFVIDHAASGLTAPDPTLAVGLHDFHSSPAFMDVAPASWEELSGQLFIAEYGDLAPNTDPTFERRTGIQVVGLDPDSGTITPFLRNVEQRTASDLGQPGAGIERPFDVKFGPDGAMYVVDNGAVEIDFLAVPPYVQMPGTGVIWRVTRR